MRNTNLMMLGVVFCFLLLGPATLSAQQPVEPAFTLKQIGPNAWAAIGQPQSQANAVFVVGDDGVIIIDTPPSADSTGKMGTAPAEQLLAEIRRRTQLPIKFVVNTHYHLDHVGGNRVYSDAGALVMAHRNVRRWIHTENLKFFGKDLTQDQKSFIESMTAPAAVYDDAVDLYIGSRQVQLRTFPGHTGGDTVVVIPDLKVVVTGDLYWGKTLPNMVDALSKPWIDTLEALAQRFPDYTFIPGHGDVGTVQEVRAFHDYLQTLRKLVEEALAQRRTGDALVKSVMPALSEQFGQWAFFMYLAERNILDTEAELSGSKTTPR
jgi:glyoxylase-like metal-dependent hydrolase (beta-lactamase superfamily II)